MKLRHRQADVAHHVIVDAARRLFAKRGYARTSMADIAREADVSIQTIYANVGGKPALVMALVDHADRITNVADLARRIADARTAEQIIVLTASLRRQFMEKGADIVRTLASAAADDANVARAWREGQRRSRRVVDKTTRTLAAQGALRDGLGVEKAADILFALFTPALYARLVEECGWTPDAYETWLADAMRRLLL